MMYRVTEQPTSWEIVAAVQAIQACGQAVMPDGQYDCLYEACDLLEPKTEGELYTIQTTPFAFSPALRLMNNRVDPYWRLLAEANSEVGFATPDVPLRLSIPTSDDSKILLCPYGPDQNLNLNLNVWKYITKSLRSYTLPVKMLGDEGQRMDSSAFLEDDTLSSFPFTDKLNAVASATLVVGVPNAWIWLAAALGKKTIVLYPDASPHNRWLWQTGTHIVRLVYERDKVQIPVLLTGIRKAIAGL